MKHEFPNGSAVYCGDCTKIVGLLPNDYVDGIVIDPPYGESILSVGDRSVTEAVGTLFRFLVKSKAKLKWKGHIAVFWTMRNLDVCIDVIKDAGYTYRRVLSMYIPRGSARPYLGWLPRTQAIVIAQKYLPTQPLQFHAELAGYLSQALCKSKLNCGQVARHLGCDSRLVMKWTRADDPAWCLPTPRFYKPLKELLDLDGQFDILLRDRRPGRRNDLRYMHDTYIVDDRAVNIVHPTQKPLFVVEHLVECIAPAGGVILDGFAGGGTTAIACVNTDRRFICIEIDAKYYDQMVQSIRDRNLKKVEGGEDVIERS